MKLMLICVFLGLINAIVPNGIPSKACINYYRDGDFIIGGMFPLRYVEFPEICAREGKLLSPHGLRNAESMVFAMEYVNSLPHILPNITLGFDIRDDCRSEHITLFQASTLITSTGAVEFTEVCGKPPGGQNISEYKQVIAIVGTGENPSSIVAAHVGSVTHVPIISWSAGGDDLHDEQRFPFFTRTVPPDSGQVGGLVDLLLHYEWLYVGVLYSRDSEGLFNSQSFKSQAEPRICIAYFEPVSLATSDADMNDILEKIRDFDKATVLVMLVFDNQIALKVFRALNETGLAGKVTIVCATGCGYGLERRGLGNATYGGFFIRTSEADVPQFDDFYHAQDPDTMEVSPWFREFWEDADGAVPDPRMGGSSVINAVSIVAHALDSMLQNKCKNSGQCRIPSRIDTSLLMEYIKNVSFTTITGDIFQFQSDGEAASEYTFSNMQFDGNEFDQVDALGRWNGLNNTGNVIHLKTNEIHFKDGIGEVPKSICREECPVGSYPVPLARKCCWGCRICPVNAIVMITGCTLCPNTHWPNDLRTTCEEIVPTVINWNDALIITIVTLTAFGILLSALVTSGLIIFVNHALIKSTSRELSGINIIGIAVTYLAVFVFLVRPSTIACAFTESILALSFTITYAPTMLKVNRIYRIFKSGRKSVKRPRWVGPRPQIIMCFALIMIQVITSLISSLVTPCKPTLLFPPQPRNHVELYCSFGQGFIVSIAYNLIIILACCFYAFRARKVPANYNESKFIAVSVYSTLVLSLATVPVYLTSDEILPKIVTICLALLLNAYQTLACVYLPKLYAITFVGEGLEIDDWRSTIARTIVNSRVHPSNQDLPGPSKAQDGKSSMVLRSKSTSASDT